MPYNFAYQVKERETQFSQKVNSDGEVVTGEYRVLLPDGRTQIVSYTADWKNGYNAKVRYEGSRRDENEKNLQPGGFPAPPTPTPKPCPPGQFRLRRPGAGESGCQPFHTNVDSQGIRPNDQERDNQPGGPVTLCPPTYSMSSNGKCREANEQEGDLKPGGSLPPAPTVPPCPASPGRCNPSEEEEELQPGVFLPRPMSPCPSGYMRYPGKGYANCHKLETTRRGTRAPIPSQSISKSEVNENEESILRGGHKPSMPCPRSFFYSTPGRQCRPRPRPSITPDKAKCIADSKDPRSCFPELCFPGSPHPGCRVKPASPIPSVDEREEDIQAAGNMPPPPPPSKPTNLYGTPDMSFGVRLHPKFGH